MAAKRKGPTEAERLRHQCPKCWANPGEQCTDPAGNACDKAHRTRGPGAAQDHAEKAAERKNARAMASYGALFQPIAEEEVKPTTAAEVMFQERTSAAHAFDATHGPTGVALLRQCNRGMELIRIHHMSRILTEMAGELGAIAARHSLNTYPIDYQEMHFRELFTTTKKVPIAWGRRFDPARVNQYNREGLYVVCEHAWEPAAPLMTVEEFSARFSRLDHFQGLKDAPEPDDAGLFDRTIGRLTQPRHQLVNSPVGRPE